MKIYDEEILYQIVKVFKPDRLYQHINIKGFDLRIKNSKVESKNIIVSNFVPHPLGLYRPSETVFHCAGMSSVSNREKLINKLSMVKRVILFLSWLTVKLLHTLE